MNCNIKETGRRAVAAILAVVIALTNGGFMNLAYGFEKMDRVPQKTEISITYSELMKAVETEMGQAEAVSLFGLPEEEGEQDTDAENAEESPFLENLKLPFSEAENEAFLRFLEQSLEEKDGFVVKTIDGEEGETEAVVVVSPMEENPFLIYTFNGTDSEKSFELTLPGMSVEQMVRRDYAFGKLGADGGVDSDEEKIRVFTASSATAVLSASSSTAEPVKEEETDDNSKTAVIDLSSGEKKPNDVTKKVRAAFQSGKAYTYQVNGNAIALLAGEVTEDQATIERRNAIKALVEEWFGENKKEEPIKISVAMNPGSGEILAGENVTWVLDLQIAPSNVYLYNKFTSANNTIFDEYQDTKIRMALPKGIKVSSVKCGDYKWTSVTDENGSVSIVIDMGDIAAGSGRNLEFTIAGKVDGNGEIGTGKPYTIKQSDITYETTIDILDRDANDDVFETCEVTGNTVTDTSNMSLESGTNDAWMVQKEATSYEFSDDKEIVTVFYKVQVGLADDDKMKTGWNEYAVNGRVPFAEKGGFTLTEEPYAQDGDTCIEPFSVTIKPENFTADAATGGTSVTTHVFGTNENTTDPQAIAAMKDFEGRSVPIFSTYTVEAKYRASNFQSNFYDEKTIETKNKVTLDYELKVYHEGVKAEEGTSIHEVENEGKYVNGAVEVQLSKYISSVSGSGDYTTETGKLADRFNGEAVFSISPVDDAEEKGVYIKEEDGQYTRIQNDKIVFSRGQITVTAKDEEKQYVFNTVPMLYVLEGEYSVKEVSNKIEGTTLKTIEGATKTEGEKGYQFSAKVGEQVSLMAINSDEKGRVEFKKIQENYNQSILEPLEGAVFAIFNSYEEAKADHKKNEGEGILAVYMDLLAPRTTADDHVAVSDGEGIVRFENLAPGTYYIREISSPDNYITDTDTIYKVEVTANQTTTKLYVATGENTAEGTPVEQISNKINSGEIVFRKWIMTLGVNKETKESFITRTAVGQAELDTFKDAFRLQCYNTKTDSWQDIDERKSVLERKIEKDSEGKDVTVSGFELKDLPVYIGDDIEKPYLYRIVETLPQTEGDIGYSGYAGLMHDGKGNVLKEDDGADRGMVDYVSPREENGLAPNEIATRPFSLTDTIHETALYNQTKGSASMTKVYYYSTPEGPRYMVPGENGMTEVTGYLCTLNEDGKYVIVGSDTTEKTTVTGSTGESQEKHMATVSGLDLIDENGTTIPYFWAEAVPERNDYVLADSELATIYNADGEEITAYVSKKPSYATIYAYQEMAVELDNILPLRRIDIRKYAIYGGNKTENFLAGAKYEIKRVGTDENGKEQAFEFGTDGWRSPVAGFMSGISEEIKANPTYAVLETGYKYRLYETPPANASGLKDETGTVIPYIEIDLTDVNPSSLEELQDSYGTYTLYDEPYPKVKLGKKVISSESESTKSDITFSVYVCNEEEGIYTLLEDVTYKPWETLSLEAGKYYYFVENPSGEQNLLSPEVYRKDSTAKFERFETKDGSLWGVPTGLLSVQAETYDLGVLNNYENTGSLRVKKYIAGSEEPLAGAEISVCKKNEKGELEVVKTTITDTSGVYVFEDLPVYDQDGEPITYYVKETNAPDKYFLTETIREVTLLPCEKVESEPLYNEPEVKVSVQVTWEDCYDAYGEIQSGGNNTDPTKADYKNWLSNLEGATVAAYRKVVGEDGTVTWEFTGKTATSDKDGRASFEQLSRLEEYIFVLADSNMTEEKTQQAGYPGDTHLYASEDGTQDYLAKKENSWKQTLTGEELAHLNYIHYKNNGEAYKEFTKFVKDADGKDGNLNNHLMYTEVDVLKYCPQYESHQESTKAKLKNGTDVSLLNGALFGVYRQKLTKEQLQKLAEGELELSFDEGKVELLDTQESGSTSLGSLSFAPLTYAEEYVYWVVELSPTANHTWPEGMDSYRILLYAPTLEGKIASQDAVIAEPYRKNGDSLYEVENRHGTGNGAHTYYRTYLYMNKWQGKYDRYGDVAEGDTRPLGGAGFTYYLQNKNGVALPLYAETETTSMSSYNNLGYMGPGALYWAELYNQFITAIVNEQHNTQYENIGQIQSVELDAVPEELWEKYADLLYVYEGASAPDRASLTDLAAENGRAAKKLFKEYKSQNGDNWSYIRMEKVMTLFANGAEEVYGSFYAHVVFHETSVPTGFLKNQEEYELYVGFVGTDVNGAINTRYYWLDGSDGETDAWYTSDPGYLGQPKDETLYEDANYNNAVKSQIINMPDPEYSLSIWKYGYTANEENLGMTNEELNTWFMSGAGLRVPLEGTEFVLQRWNTTANKGNGQWQYYSYNAKDKTGSYVAGEKEAIYVDQDGKSGKITTGSDGVVAISLPIGYYRLIETKTNDDYEMVYDGSVTKTAVAAVYFYQEANKTGNVVTVHNPRKLNLTIEKDTLSTFAGNLIGVIFTIEKGDEKLTETTLGDGRVIFRQISSGTWTVTEKVREDNSVLTDRYFTPFDVTLGFTRTTKAVTMDEGKEVPVVVLARPGITIEDGAAGVSSRQEENTFNAVLTVKNPRRGELEIRKLDQVTGNGGLKATFKVYYRPFEDFSSQDRYVADVSDEKKPVFDPTNLESWEMINETVVTSGGSYTLRGLDPGWYAVEEITPPSGYEIAEPQVVCVQADMTEDHSYRSGKAEVKDLRKVSLAVRKNFNSGDFYSELAAEARDYQVTLGLYVRGRDGTYYDAETFGLVSESKVTIQTSNVNTLGQFYNSETWTGLVQMGESLEEDETYLASDGKGNTVALDGKYYVKEEKIMLGEADQTANWWPSEVTFTYPYGSEPVTIKADEQGYFPLEKSAFTANQTGAIVFNNNFSYARVTIQKTGTGGVPLTGAVFKVKTSEGEYLRYPTETASIVESIDNQNGTYTIYIPIKTLEKQSFDICEEKAPEHYTLNETPIRVSVKSGDSLSYARDQALIMRDDNGLNIYLTKYDNVRANSNAQPIGGVTFTLYKSTKTLGDGTETAGEEGEWSDWKPVFEPLPTGDDGVLRFDTIVVDPASYRYALVETGYDSARFVGQESLWLRDRQIQEQCIINDKTAYILPLDTTDIGSDYMLKAYNIPRIQVRIFKTATDRSAAAGTKIGVYPLDAEQYSDGQALTEAQIEAIKSAAGTNRKQGNTAGNEPNVLTGAYDGYSASFVDFRLAPGMYLVVEEHTADGYARNKDDEREVWYRVIEVKIPESGTSVAYSDRPLVNVKENYQVDLKKTGPEELSGSLLDESAEVSYTLAADITNSGPLTGLEIEDSGLAVTKLYQDFGETTVEASRSPKTTLDYEITSVTIPKNASYQTETMVFTSGDKENFIPQITATVEFQYTDGETETQTQLLSLAAPDGWKVSPSVSGKKAVGFKVSWEDSALREDTGYALGADFNIGDNIVVACWIDGQSTGAQEYLAVAEFANTASAKMNHKQWNQNTQKVEPATKKDTAEAATKVPNVDPPKLSIGKSVVNRRQPEQTTNITVQNGDTLDYTIQVGNTGSTMYDPVIVDLLPRGMDVVQATNDMFVADARIPEGDLSGLQIEQVNLFDGASYEYPGYQVLVIYLKGALERNETVSVTLTGTVGYGMIQYLESASFKNMAWVTSMTPGKLYGTNKAGSSFRGNTGAWASDLGDNSEDPVKMAETVKKILDGNHFVGYGYVSDYADVTYSASTEVTVFKEVTGDQDNGNWYYGGNAATATGNQEGVDSDNNGWAKFRLILDNQTDMDLVNPIFLDMIPRVGDINIMGSGRGSQWNAEFDKVLSVLLNNTEVSEENYEIWYYTGEIDTQGEGTNVTVVDQNGNAFKDLNLYGIETDSNKVYNGWTSTLPDERPAEGAVEGAKYREDVTAFIVQFKNVRIPKGLALTVTYQIKPEELTHDKFRNAAHKATYNTYYASYKKAFPKQPDDTAILINDPVPSNTAMVIYEPSLTAVGGMVWIDANGNGVQDPEDVVVEDSSTGLSETIRKEKNWKENSYDRRTNNYRDYKVVRDLIGTVSIKLQSYLGATAGDVTLYNDSTHTISAFDSIFRFENLHSASLVTYYSETGTGLNFGDDGVYYNRLVGGSTAFTYRLLATVGGNVGVKYRVTKPRAAKEGTPNATEGARSYDPECLYAESDQALNQILESRWEKMTGDAKTVYGNDQETYKKTEKARFDAALLDSNFLVKTDSSESTDKPTMGPTSAQTGRFFLFVSDEVDMSKDIGLTLYRDLEIKKTDEKTGGPVEGAEFTIYGPFAEGMAETFAKEMSGAGDGNASGTAGAPDPINRVVGTYKTGKDGCVTIEDKLLYLQEYVIVETKTPEGYTSDSAKLVSINANVTTVGDDPAQKAWILKIPSNDPLATGAVSNPNGSNSNMTDHMEITNELGVGALNFRKLETGSLDNGGEGIAVPGARFTLAPDTTESATVSSGWTNWLNLLSGKTEAEKTDMGIGQVAIDSAESVPKLAFVTTGSNAVRLENLPNGTYTLTETNPAPGYVLGEKIRWTVVVDGAEVTIDGESTTSEDPQIIYNTYTPSGSLTLYAEKIEKNYISDKEYSFAVYEAEILDDGDWKIATNTDGTEKLQARGTVNGAKRTVLLSTDSNAASAQTPYTVSYDRTGTYYYIIKEETKPEYEGIHFDASEYHVTVEVTDEKHVGILNAEVSEVEKVTKTIDEDRKEATTKEKIADPVPTTFPFTNTYKAKGELELSVTKQLVDGNGKPYTTWSGAESVFTFELWRAGERIDEAQVNAYAFTSNAPTANVKFKKLVYGIDDVGKTFTYLIKEKTTPVDGFVLDGNSYTVKVTPKDKGDGTLKLDSQITMFDKQQEDITFTNVYTPKGSISLSMKKTLDGGETIPEGKFSVSIVQLATDANAMPYESAVAGNGVGKKNWKRKENDAGTRATIGTDGNVTLIPYKEYSEGTSGTVYDRLNFTAAGTYWYLVTETLPEDFVGGEDAYRYDATEYFVRIEATDNHDGTLTTKVAGIYKDSPQGILVGNDGTLGTITFKNLSTVEYSVKKVWSGDNSSMDVTRPESIFVKLQKKNGENGEWEDVGESVELNSQNDWQNVWTDLDLYVTGNGSSADTKWQYRVVELDDNSVVDGNGTLSGKNGSKYQVTYSEDSWTPDAVGEKGSITITNTLQTGALKVKKEVKGKDSTGETFKFAVKFTMSNGSVPLTGSYEYSKNDEDEWKEFDLDQNSNGAYFFTLGAGEEIEFRNLPVGVHYEVTETPVSGYRTTVTEDGSGEIGGSEKAVTFTNYYAETSLTLTGTKQVTGLSEKVPADKQKTFKFVVKQTEPSVPVTEDSVVSRGTVTIDNDEVKDFTFTPELKYTLSDLDGSKEKEFTYLIYEEQNNLPGYTFDKTKYTVKVKVTYGEDKNALSAAVTEVTSSKVGSGTESGANSGSQGSTDTDISSNFAFVNHYQAVGTTQISAEKLLNGLELGEYSDADGAKPYNNKFKFKLTSGTVSDGIFTPDENGAEEKFANGTTSMIEFAPIQYEHAGTYWYCMEEVPETGFVTDKNKYYVKVEVKDNFEGALTAEQTIYKNGVADKDKFNGEYGIRFENSTSTEFAVTKQWIGDEDCFGTTRPDSVSVILKRTASTDIADENNWKRVDSSFVTLNEETSWSYNWNTLFKYEDNDVTKPYRYKAVEVKVSTGNDGQHTITELAQGDFIEAKSGGGKYSISYGDVDQNSQTITNSLGANLSFTKSKVIAPFDDNNRSYIFKLTVDLPDDKTSGIELSGNWNYRITESGQEKPVEEGSKTINDGKVLKFSIKEGQTVTIENLPLGTEYTLKEDEPGYIATFSNASSKETVPKEIKGTLDSNHADVSLDVINTYEATGELPLSVKKVLDDGITPVPEETFTFVLEKAEVSEASVAADGSGNSKVPELIGTEKSMSRTVSAGTEENPEGTAVFADDDMLKWTYKKGLNEDLFPKGKVYWYILKEEKPSEAGTAPYKYDATKYYIKVEVKESEEHNGKLTLTKTVYKKDNPESSDYTIVAGPTTGDLDTSVMTFHNYSTVDMAVEKIWDDDNNRYGTRPDSVRVALQRKKTEVGNPSAGAEYETMSGDEYIQTLTKDSWSYTWTGLRTSEVINGKKWKYDYRIVEVKGSGNDVQVISPTDANPYIAGENKSQYRVSYSVDPSSGRTVIKNELVTTSLEISKIVNGKSEDQQKQEFKFSVYLYKNDGTPISDTTYQYAVMNADGNAESTIHFVGGKAEISLKHGQPATITGLPIGMKYRIVEMAPEGNENKYTTIHTVNGKLGTGDGKDTGEQELLSQNPEQVSFTNTKLENLNIEKLQEGGLNGETFTVLVKTKDVTNSTTGNAGNDWQPYAGSYTVKAKGGEEAARTTTNGEIPIQAGEMITIELPYGTGYRVEEVLTETQKAQYSTPSYRVNDGSETSTIPESDSNEGNVYIVNRHKTAELKISKIAKGGYDEAEFTFTVEDLFGENDRKDRYDVIFYDKENQQKTEKGVIDTDHKEITLKSGESAVIEGIDIGKTIRVTETEAKIQIDGTWYPISIGNYYTYINGGDESGTFCSIKLEEASKQYQVMYRNVYKTGTIQIQKTDGTDDGTGSAPKPIKTLEAQFLVLREGVGGFYEYMTEYSGNTVDAAKWISTGEKNQAEAIKLAKEADRAAKQQTNNEGILELDNLELGTYVFVEAAAPTGYALSSKPLVIELKEDSLTEGILKAEFENEEIPGSVSFKKQDNVTQSNLDGVTFTLYRTDGAYTDSATGTATKILAFVTGSKEVTLDANLTDSVKKLYDGVSVERAEDGTITLAELPWGTYKLTETAGEAYVQPEEEHDTSYQEFCSEFTVGVTGTTFAENTNKKTLYNEKKTGSLTIGKTVTDNAGSRSEGEKFVFKVTLINEFGEDYLEKEDQRYTIRFKKKNSGGFLGAAANLLADLFNADGNPDKTEAAAKNADGNYVSITQITLADGDQAVIEDLPYGTRYLIEEIRVEGKTDDSYLADHYEITWLNKAGEPGMTGVIGYKGDLVSEEPAYIAQQATASNARRVGRISVRKLDAENALPLSGVEFTVYSDSNCKTAVKDKDGKTVVLQTNDDGYAESPDLYPGTYYVKETKKHSGYQMRETIYRAVVSGDGETVALDWQNAVAGSNSYFDDLADAACREDGLIPFRMEGVITNIHTYGHVTITKYGSSKQVKLEGVTFDLFRRMNAESGHEDVKIASGLTTGPDGIWSSVNENKILNAETGKPLSHGLWEGEYYFKESDSGSAYVLETEKEIGFTIGEDNQYDNRDAATVLQVSMDNKPIETALRLLKTDQTNGNALTGTQFTLYRMDESGEYRVYGIMSTEKKGTKVTWKDVEGNPHTYELKEDGELYMGGLLKGQYLLEETGTSLGYMQGKEPFSYRFTVTDADDKAVIFVTDALAGTGKDEGHVTNRRIPGTLILEKLDAETLEALNGVTFALYKRDKADGVFEKIRDFFTGKSYSLAASIDPADAVDGTLRIDGLAWGDYCITEVKALDGYILKDSMKHSALDENNSYYFSLGLNEGVFTQYCYLTVDEGKAITNSRNRLLIHKVDRRGNSLAGATFTITGQFAETARQAEGFKWAAKDGLETLTFTSKSQYTELHGLLIGGNTYKLEETKAPSGYVRLTTPIQFTMEKDGTVTLVSGPTEAVLDGENRLLTISNTPRGSSDGSDGSDGSGGSGGHVPVHPTDPTKPGPGNPENQTTVDVDGKDPTIDNDSDKKDLPVDHIGLNEPEPGDKPSISYTVVPKTGDDTNLTMWLFLAGASGTAVVLLFLAMKKKDEEKRENEA